ncbi:MAG TPA: hypothetical protein VGS41_17015, partial [Chthonomonadales bacterium]|nr:hypothetical protein [Chthonomonadales bacterium]
MANRVYRSNERIIPGAVGETDCPARFGRPCAAGKRAIAAYFNRRGGSLSALLRLLAVLSVAMAPAAAVTGGAGPRDVPAPAGSLYRFTPDRHAGGDVTHATIDAARTGATPISPLLFGEFLEHLGHTINGGLWSQLLLNPGLEQIEPTESEPEDWSLSGSARWVDPGYLSPRCVQLDVAAQGALRQTIYLPVSRTEKYTGY